MKAGCGIAADTPDGVTAESGYEGSILWVFAIREVATTLQLTGDRTDTPVGGALIQLNDFRR